MRIAFLGDNRSQNARSWLQGLKDNGAGIYEWPAKGFVRDMLRILQIRSWLKKVNPDLVIGYRTTSYGFLAALVARQPLVVAVQGETDLWPYSRYTLPFKKLFKWYCVKKAKLIHAWGENMVPSLLKHGAVENKILVMPRGVDIRTFTYVEKKAELLLISTRSLYPEYNHMLSLTVVAELKKQGITGKLIFLGEGPERIKLRERALLLGIVDLIEFRGKMIYTEIPVLLQRSKFYISLPQTEGTSTSLLEAMASGCYPVVADLPANRAWIESGKNGLLSGNPQAIAKHIIMVHRDEDYFLQAIRFNRKQVETRADFQHNIRFFYHRYQKLVRA